MEESAKYYNVTLTHTATTRVLAHSESEAIENVDLSDLRYDIQHCGPDEDITAELIEQDSEEVE